jgi:hypothetical protein
MVGSVTLSVEIEPGWGHHDLPPGQRQPLSDGRTAETEALKRLLGVCDDHGVPITFDIVGHLLEETCIGSHDGPHPRGWFDADPGTGAGADPQFYAPDLLQMIQERMVDHEIATHTYSHVLCDEVDESVIDWELSTCSRLHREHGLATPRSIVTPRHRTIDREQLSAHGIDVLRVPFSDYNAPDGRLAKFWWMLTRDHPVGAHCRSGDIVETYCTPHPSLTAAYLPSGLQPPHPAFRSIPIGVRKWLHERYLCNAVDRAVSSNQAVHLWSHLFNLACGAQLEPVESFIEYLDAVKAAGDVVIQPMEALAA